MLGQAELPLPVTIVQNSTQVAPGYVFITPTGPGGLAPLLVFADADLDAAVTGTMLAKFRNTGQSCIAANRVYVERSIYEKFVEALTVKTKALKK